VTRPAKALAMGDLMVTNPVGGAFWMTSIRIWIIFGFLEFLDDFANVHHFQHIN
jgi:hypothetical protein